MPSDEENFYRLPFEPGTFQLTEETLFNNSFHRKRPSYFREKIKNISFHNEVLILSIKLEQEPKNRQLVYIKVQKNELLVCCSAGTTSSYLSRFAFFTLLDLVQNEGNEFFLLYYWPDFFDPLTGRSKYLRIINDRKGLDIEEKSKYPSFHKPGLKLLDLHNEPAPSHRSPIPSVSIEEQPEGNTTIAYCLAYGHNTLSFGDHFPFLVPCLALLTRKNDQVKTFAKFLLTKDDYENIEPTARQEQLKDLCFKMAELAVINREHPWKSKTFNKDDLEKARQLLDLWHETLELLLTQKFTAHHRTKGLKSLQQKPKRDSFYVCSFKKEQPNLVIIKTDKGDYLTIELKLRIDNKLFIPFYPRFPLLISKDHAPTQLYLLQNYTDYIVLNFFSNNKFKLAVLKCHYKDEIKDLVEVLAERYELREY